MIRIFVDSGIDLFKDKLDKLNIGIVPLSVAVNDEELESRLDLTNEEKSEYYNLLSRTVVRTSRPPLGEIKNIFTEELDRGNDIIYIAMSSV